MFSASTKSAHPSGAVNWIDDVFSTYLYTGNGSSQTITNGIDLAGEGGLVWIKKRNFSGGHELSDTNRGAGYYVVSNSTDAQSYNVQSGATSFLSNGFTVGNDDWTNGSGGQTYASWTFRKQAKFFDIVTYTGNGTSGRSIAHNLGSTPGCIIIKALGTVGGSNTNWFVYHKDAAGGGKLNLTDSMASGFQYIDASNTNSSVFTLFYNSVVNFNNTQYVAYLFAHDAGGFGTSGTDNVISCGSFTTDSSSNFSVTLGYEPQWLLVKRTDSSTAGGWLMLNTMAEWSETSANYLQANASNAQTTSLNANYLNINATGFSSGTSAFFTGSATYIYIAIRRPMKPPTTGTSVFSPINTSQSAGNQQTTGFPVDMQLQKGTSTNYDFFALDRLRGISTVPTTDSSQRLATNTTNAEGADTSLARYWNSTGFETPSFMSTSGDTVFLNFKRASGFFDVVCYTGNATGGRTINHNLTVAPELIIAKGRSSSTGWTIYNQSIGNNYNLSFTSNPKSNAYDQWYSTTPSATTFTVNAGGGNNGNGVTYVAYLFATVSGVSKVGSYTGTGGTFTINCGFTGGARFVMIKRTDDIGSWWVWDTSRGMVAGTDPRLSLNSYNAQQNQNWVYTTTTGFQVVGTDATINASGGSYIYLAIA